MEAVKVAISTGYRLIDCAYAYGNEAEVGQAIKAKIDDGTVKREDLFVISKLWNTRHRPEDVRYSLQESLDLLGLQYLDLYLIHWPHAMKSNRTDNFPRDAAGKLIYDDVDYLDTYKAMEPLVREGLTRDIGVSNFNSRQVQRVLENCSVKPAVNQIEIHPYLPNEKLVKFCQEKEVRVMAYAPLASPDRPWAPSGEPILVEDPRLKAIAAKYNKSPAQVIFRWLLQRDIIIIPKSGTPSRIVENFNVFDFKLSAEDISAMAVFDKGPAGRIVVPMEQVDGKQIFRDRDAKYFPFTADVEF
jgi:diketogulonate reductase-like aldo/keto reductase